MLHSVSARIKSQVFLNFHVEHEERQLGRLRSILEREKLCVNMISIFLEEYATFSTQNCMFSASRIIPSRETRAKIIRHLSSDDVAQHPTTVEDPEKLHFLATHIQSFTPCWCFGSSDIDADCCPFLIASVLILFTINPPYSRHQIQETWHSLPQALDR
jgi:hypothetical protein